MPRSVRACQFLSIQVPVVIQQNSDTSLIPHYSLSYLLSVRPLGHHAGLPMLDCWTVRSRVSKYLHNGRQGLMLLHMQIIKRHAQHAILTVLEVCWEMCSTAESVVCKSTVPSCEGSAGQVHSCCSLQLNYNKRFFVKVVRPRFANMPSCCRSQLVQDPYPVRVEPAC